MALEDFAMFRTVPGAACFYPSDAVSCERAIELAANYNGITFTRTSLPGTSGVYNTLFVLIMMKEIAFGKYLLCSRVTHYASSDILP